MQRALHSADIAATASRRGAAASRAARPACSAAPEAARSFRLSARFACATSAQAHAAQLRRGGGRAQVAVSAQNRPNNNNKGRDADASLAVGVPDGYVRACVDNSAPLTQSVRRPSRRARDLYFVEITLTATPPQTAQSWSRRCR